MSVRAKMKCESKSDAADSNGGDVRLFPVMSGSEENDSFYKYTPGGSLHLSTINQAAFDHFEVGKEYYIDIKPAEPVDLGGL